MRPAAATAAALALRIERMALGCPVFRGVCLVEVLEQAREHQAGQVGRVGTALFRLHALQAVFALELVSDHALEEEVSKLRRSVVLFVFVVFSLRWRVDIAQRSCLTLISAALVASVAFVAAWVQEWSSESNEKRRKRLVVFDGHYP